MGTSQTKNENFNEELKDEENLDVQENLNQNFEQTENSEKSLNVNVSKEKNEKTPKNFFEKVKNFVKIKKEYFIMLGIYVGLFLIFMLLSGLFTSKNSILFGDAYEQIGAFFDHIFNVLEGKSSLFYSNYFGKGMEVFSTIQYMFTNPFYIFVLIGGRANVYSMFTLSLFCMLALNGIVFLWFENKYFKNLSPFLKITFALLYIFSGYVNFSYAFTTWLIYPALLLLVVDRFIEFTKTGKIGWFIVFFVWYVIACYSVGISTTIVLFVLFTIYILLITKKEERMEKLSSLFVVFLVTVIASITLILPSVLAVLGTGRSSFLKTILGGEYIKPMQKLGVVFSDMAILVLAVFYLFKCNKKDKLNKFFIISFIILLMPVLFDATMVFLCLSRYQGFYCRFYFLNEALVFFLALKLLDGNLVQIKDGKSEQIYKILFILFVSLIVTISLILDICAFSYIGANVKSPLSDKNESSTLYSIFFVMILFVFAFVYFLNKFKLVSKKMVKLAVPVLLIVTLFINFLNFTSAGGTTDKDRKGVQNLIYSSGVTEGSFKNIGLATKFQLLNYSNYGIRKSSAFSSLLTRSAINSFKYMTYYAGSTCYDDVCGNLISDSLMGIKYYVSSEKLDRPYLELVKENDGYYLYKNILAGSGAIALSSDFSFDEDATFYQNIEKLETYFGISGVLFSDVNVNEIEITDEEKLLSDIGYCKKYEYTATEDGFLYVGCLYTRLVGDSELLKDIPVYAVSANNGDYIEEMAYLRAGDSYTFYFKGEKEKDISYKFLSYETASKLCEKIVSSSLEYNYEKNGYSVSGNLENDSTIYVFSPNLKGYTYELNGEKIENSLFFVGFDSFSASSGEVKLTAKYSYPYTKTWILAFVISAILIAGILLLYHFTKFKHIQKIIGFTMIAVLGIILLVFYVGGMIISIINFFIVP